MKHTETPWHDGGEDREGKYRIWFISSPPNCIAEIHERHGGTEQDRDLILEAVNNHDRLTAENARLRAALQACYDERTNAAPSDVMMSAYYSRKITEQARAALGGGK